MLRIEPRGTLRETNELKIKRVEKREVTRICCKDSTAEKPELNDKIEDQQNKIFGKQVKRESVWRFR